MNVHLMIALDKVPPEERSMPTAAPPAIRDGGWALVGGATLLYDIGGGARLNCGVTCCPKADGCGCSSGST
jgi:hypothetical protein